MWTEYCDDFSVFYNEYVENGRKYGNNLGVLAQKGMVPPENAYTVSCVPWISFKHFAVHSYDNKPYYFPSVEAGRFYEKDGKELMPLSLTCHHAATDGYHISLFIEQFQKYADSFEQFVK